MKTKDLMNINNPDEKIELDTSIVYIVATTTHVNSEEETKTRTSVEVFEHPSDALVYFNNEKAIADIKFNKEGRNYTIISDTNKLFTLGELGNESNYFIHIEYRIREINV